MNHYTLDCNVGTGKTQLITFALSTMLQWILIDINYWLSYSILSIIHYYRLLSIDKHVLRCLQKHRERSADSNTDNNNNQWNARIFDDDDHSLPREEKSQLESRVKNYNFRPAMHTLKTAVFAAVWRKKWYGIPKETLIKSTKLCQSEIARIYS